jgi:acetyl esterase/lipase
MPRSLLLLALLLAFSVISPAVWAQRARASAPKLTEAPVKTEERVFKHTPQGDLTMHLFLPPTPGKGRPGIVFFFGGGWKSGSYLQFVPQAAYFASRGMVAACADYRIASVHKTTPDKCVEDAKSAMRWLRAHAEELGLDPARLVAAGGSAGGHLAAATALVPGFDAEGEDLSISCKPAALVLFNPALNLTNIDGREIPGADGRNIAKELSPTLFLSKDAPPAIQFFGTADKLAAHGTEYLEKARTLGAKAELWMADGLSHGFFNRSPWTEVTTRQADAFLASLGYLAGSPAVKLPADAPSLEKR